LKNDWPVSSLSTGNPCHTDADSDIFRSFFFFENS
jgi:hypothetical protein